MTHVTCSRCQESKPANTEFFPPHNKKLNGLDSWCRVCRSSYRSGINRGKFRNVISDEALLKLKTEITQCVICGSEEKLVVDHDHNSGEIRGLLCNHCNRGLGHFRDDPMLLEFAAQYLYASNNCPEWDKYLKEQEVLT